MKIFKKIQKLDLKKRKLIYWIVIIFLGIFLLFLWAKITALRIERLKGQKFFKEINLPKIEIPELKIPTLNIPTPNTPTKP